MAGDVKSMRGLVALAGAAVLVAACGRAPSTQASGGYRLFEATAQHSQIAVIDTRTHAIERTLPLGTPSPDWSHLYSVRAGTLLDTDPATGATLHTLELPGDYQLPPATLSGLPGGLSQNGRWLALQSVDAAAAVRSFSHLVLVDTSYAKAPLRVDLRGDFTFDAISNDGRRMFLIEHASATTYRVRMYDVGSGTLNPNVVFDKSDGSEAMTGLRISGIPSTDGRWLFSMYVREGASPFIHALSLDGPLAFCIELPGSGYASDANAFGWSIAMAAGGATLYAANAASGVASELNTGPDDPPSLERSTQIGSGSAVARNPVQDAQAKELGANAAVITPDGKTLVTASDHGVVWIDTSGLKAHTRLLGDWTVASLALSADGSTLWALSDSGRIAEISMASRHIDVTFDPSAGSPLALMRVEAV